MSPTEAQLRAALHEGEGARIDAGRIIAAAERHRRARRQRLTNLAAAASVVAVLGLGGGLVALTRSGSEQGGSSAGTAAGRAPMAGAQPASSPAHASGAGAAGGAGNGGSGSAAGGVSANASAVGCPATPGSVAVQASTRADRAAPLLSARPATITACGYSPQTARVVHRTVLESASASRLVAALNNGSVAPVFSNRACPAKAGATRLTLLATTADGRRAKAVHVRVSCPNVVATNGTAVRYWPDLPSELKPLVR